VPKGFFLVIIEPFFRIEGSLELSKEPYASYRLPMNPFFFPKLHASFEMKAIMIEDNFIMQIYSKSRTVNYCDVKVILLLINSNL